MGTTSADVDVGAAALQEAEVEVKTVLLYKTYNQRALLGIIRALGGELQGAAAADESNDPQESYGILRIHT